MEVSQFLASLDALLSGETDTTANMANAAAYLYHTLDDLNWAGFYVLKRDMLVLGPFQGKPACTRIALSRGVCAAAFTRNRALRVDDVHMYPGHIACDEASRSELVLPLRNADGAPFGVLDLDSTHVGRFTEADEALLTEAAAHIASALGEVNV